MIMQCGCKFIILLLLLFSAYSKRAAGYIYPYYTVIVRGDYNSWPSAKIHTKLEMTID